MAVHMSIQLLPAFHEIRRGHLVLYAGTGRKCSHERTHDYTALLYIGLFQFAHVI